MAEDGKKMSKRLKNYTPPNTLLESYGADALRLYLIQSNLVKAEEQRFSDNGVKEIVRRVLLPWHNAIKFLTTYTDIDQWQPSTTIDTKNNILDCWIQSRLQTLCVVINQQMQRYQLHSIVFHVLDFLDDLTNTYIRLNRSRFWGDGVSDDKQQAYQCLYSVLKEFSIIMAPFSPFLSEHVYQTFKKRFTADNPYESIHMLRYPQAKTEKTESRLEHAVSVMQQIILLGRQCRNDAKIKIKTPLQTLTIIHSQSDVLEAIKPLEHYICKELNVKEIHYDHQEEKYIRLSAKINAAKLGRSLGKEIPVLNREIQALDFTAIQHFEQTREIHINNHVLCDDDLLIYRQALPDSQAISNRFVTISMDLNLSRSLIDEGIARELVTNIQTLRKNNGFHVSDRIHIEYDCHENLEKIIEAHRLYIMTETLCEKLTAMSSLNTEHDTHLVSIDELQGRLTLTRMS